MCFVYELFASFDGDVAGSAVDSLVLLCSYSSHNSKENRLKATFIGVKLANIRLSGNKFGYVYLLYCIHIL